MTPTATDVKQLTPPEISPETTQRIFDVFGPAIQVVNNKNRDGVNVNLSQVRELYLACKNNPIEFEDADYPDVGVRVALSSDGQAIELTIEPYDERPDGLTLTVDVSKLLQSWNEVEAK